mmetsp:Transcript_40464/g.59459  ORF Transcript_40464/g.59459 Transcript_40464/m.59459 type:complete len:119 (-) Transcript_40464:455-811(-)
MLASMVQRCFFPPHILTCMSELHTNLICYAIKTTYKDTIWRISGAKYNELQCGIVPCDKHTSCARTTVQKSSSGSDDDCTVIEKFKSSNSCKIFRVLRFPFSMLSGVGKYFPLSALAP